MKRLSTIMMCLFAMMAASLSAKAQEVTITLFPGWNWISYPKAETQDISTALGDFEPVNGDMLKSQFGSASYVNGYWRGSVTHFIPGWGYKYYSNRTEVVSFVFGEAAPQLTVTTAEPTEITATSSTCGGNVVSVDGNYVFVLHRGICWGTTPNPTFNDNYVEAGNGLGSFTVSLAELYPSTNYYVRAYAVTEEGTFFGEEVSFTTLNVPEGAINGLFTINADGDQVYFSKGNLQYQASSNTWRFAENQWDYVGDDTYGTVYENEVKCNNALISSTYNGWIDLFGWGTAYEPWLSDINYSAYPSSNNLADWGLNAISNGGNQEGLWRTLTGYNHNGSVGYEWTYLLTIRQTPSNIRFAKAQVNGINGLILVPDNWNPTTYSLKQVNKTDVSFSSNIITISMWHDVLENAGCVFLPIAGYRTGTDVTNVGEEGRYWSSSGRSVSYGYTTENYDAYCLNITNSHFYIYWYIGKNCGQSVRLVQDYNP